MAFSALPGALASACAVLRGGSGAAELGAELQRRAMLGDTGCVRAAAELLEEGHGREGEEGKGMKGRNQGRKR